MNVIKVQNPWFDFLVSGQKKVEGKKASPTWLPLLDSWRVNPEVILDNEQGTQAMFQITDIRRYGPLNPYFRSENGDEEDEDIEMWVQNYSPVRNYLESEGLENCLPGVGSLKDGINIYRGFSSDQELIEHDFLAIEVQFQNWV